MSSLSINVAAASCTCGAGFNDYCLNAYVAEIPMTHTVTVGDDVVTCNYQIIVYKTLRICKRCAIANDDGTHRHTETGHDLCGKKPVECSLAQIH